MSVLVILAVLGAAGCWLLKKRPFKTCPRCRGFGSTTRILGGPVPCRACHRTGLRKRTQRRKARRLLDAPARGRGRL